MYQALRSVI